MLQLHHPADNRFALRFISDDKQDRSKKASQLSEKSDVEMAVTDESLGGEMIHLLYTRPLFETAYPAFETQEDVIKWFDVAFSGGDKQILFAIIGIFDGILTEKEEQTRKFACIDVVGKNYNYHVLYLIRS